MISVIIPCYKERESLERLLPELRAKMPPCELLVVQDGPDDGTQALCHSLAVNCMRGNEAGLGDAILTGISAAHHDLVIVMDGDGQHPVDAVVEVAWALSCGTPLVFSVRYEKQGMSWARSIMSDGCALLTRPLCKMHDPMTGFFGLDRRILAGVELNPSTWKIALEIGARTGVQGTPVPYLFQKRTAGKSKASLKPAMQFISQLAKLYLWKLNLTQMMRFCIVGTSGLAVNFGLLTLLVEIFKVDYRPAAIAGITTAMLTNYLGNKFWTFRKERYAKQSIRAGERSLGSREAKA